MHRRVGEAIISRRGRAVDCGNLGWITSLAAHNALSQELDLLRWGQNGEAMRGMPEISPDMERDILTTVIDALMASALVTCV